MAKADDSSIDPDALRAVHVAARRALDRASAWEVYPTPTAVILEAANLRIAPASAFDPLRLMEYLVGKAEAAANALKSAISKVFGIYDAGEDLIHIDDTVSASKQNFLKLHEAGHHELPTHRKLFRLFQDCEKTLDPETSDLFEREANNFARFVLFQGDGYAALAADCKLEIRTPIKLAKNSAPPSTRHAASSLVPIHGRASSMSLSRSPIAMAQEPVQRCDASRPHLPSLSSSAGRANR